MDIPKTDMLGILVEDKDPGINEKENVFVNTQEALQYCIQRVSHAPLTDVSDWPKYFTGYLDCLTGGYDTHDDVSQDRETRKMLFRREFGQYMFAFRGRYDNNYGSYKLNRGSHVIRAAHIDPKQQYVTIPVFQPNIQTSAWERKERIVLNRNFLTYKEFAEILIKRNPIGFTDGIVSMEHMPFIVWTDSETMEKCAIGPFEKTVESANGYQMQFSFVGRINITEGMEQSLVYIEEMNPTVIHITEDLYTILYNRFARHDVDEVLIDEQPVLPEVTKIQNQVYDQKIEMLNEEIKTGQTGIIEITSEKSEINLLELCRFQAQQKDDLFYDFNDIINFHTAVKTGSFVILSGMSGTGKSRLVDVYARALGIPAEATLIIPVRPSWNDDSDLLGYVDLTKMVYRPSDTGFIKLIMEASRNKDQLYLVCFDEMNLARVEHYFSQFISLLEKPKDSRILRIYDESLRGHLYNAADYVNEVPIRSNIMFVGTVNIDESTYHFSDKVLDRSNIITLNVLNYSTQWTKQNYGSVKPQTWSYDDYKSLLKEPGSLDYDEYKKCLWEIHLCLQEISSSLGVGPRIVKQIEKYLCNLPDVGEKNGISIGGGFDLQIVQRVITKIRGSEEKLHEIFSKENEQDKIKLHIIFDKYSILSDFIHCRKALAEKAKELKVYGYCV